MTAHSLPIGATRIWYGQELTLTREGWRAVIQPSMLRRCQWWDYYQPWIYLLTIGCQHHAVAPQPEWLPSAAWRHPEWLLRKYHHAGRPHLFGELAEGANKAEDAVIALNAFGRKVDEMVRNLPQRFPQLSVLEHIVMPNHLHMVVRVNERLPQRQHLGILIDRFKSAVNREFKILALGIPETARMNLSYQTAGRAQCSQSATERTTGQQAQCSQAAQPSAPLRQGHGSKNPKVGLVFEAGFHDRIIFTHEQLAHAIQYCKDNPKRLWQVTHRRQYFERVMRVPVTMPFLPDGGTKGRGRWNGVMTGLLAPISYSYSSATDAPQMPDFQTVCFTMIGNRSLLTVPTKVQIQLSRQASQQQTEAFKANILQLCAHGVVPVSPCISLGERQVARAVLDAHYPLVVLFPRGIPADMKNKAGFGVYYDACASGRLLILSPWEYK